MDELSIRIEIAGRAYPLTIHKEEEVNIRKAVQEINDSITRLKQHYPTDRQAGPAGHGRLGGDHASPEQRATVANSIPKPSPNWPRWNWTAGRLLRS
jgi:hypothetical protein